MVQEFGVFWCKLKFEWLHVFDQMGGVAYMTGGKNAFGNSLEIGTAL